MTPSSPFHRCQPIKSRWVSLLLLLLLLLFFYHQVSPSKETESEEKEKEEGRMSEEKIGKIGGGLGAGERVTSWAAPKEAIVEFRWAGEPADPRESRGSIFPRIGLSIFSFSGGA